MGKFFEKINPFFIGPKFKIEFDTPQKEDWIRIVSDCRKKITITEKREIIEFVFNDNLELKNFYPIHIVLLSCFIDEIKSKGYLVQLDIKNKELYRYLFSEINLTNYWGKEKVDHVDSPTITDLNIWRITENMKESYSISVHDYFKRSYFVGHDLSAFKNSLNELYCNVFDHANAGGNSFSFIRYDKADRKINVAICDFGTGIANTLRNKYIEYQNDCEALENSIKIGISAKSQKHNRGFGLDNVASALQKDDTMRIVSNQALLRILDNKSNVKSYELDFDFKGTLIYFEISIDSFEEEEILEDFSLFY
jgi:hypothetical protein